MAPNISNRGDDPDAIPNYSRSADPPFNLSNFAPLTDEEQYDLAVTATESASGEDNEPVLVYKPSDHYTMDEWLALCQFRRGDGIVGS